MEKEIPRSAGETGKIPELIMHGSLPEIKRKKGKLQLQNIEKTELANDPEVKKSRNDLADFIIEELPFADIEVLEQMSSKQLLDLYLYYYNNPASLDHFTSIYQNLRKEKLSESIDSEEAKNAYLAYLLNKQPTSLQENQLKLAKRKKIDPELIEEITEDINYQADDEERKQIQMMTVWLESIHKQRQEKNSNSFIGFHVARSDKIKGDISSAHGIEQTNVGSDVKNIHTGARFFTTTTDPLYYPGSGEQYLYFVFANQDDLGRMYDPSEKAVFSHAPLERIPFEDLPPLHLTAEVLEDLNARFGTS